MRTLFRFSLLMILPLFVLRTADVLMNVDVTTGFFAAQTGGLFWGAGLALLALAAVLLALKNRKAYLRFAPASPSFLGALLLAVTGILIEIGSFGMLLNVIQQPGFEYRHLFISRVELFALGVTSIHFRMEFWCALLGILLIGWIFLWIAWRVGHGELAKAPVLFCLPVVWFAMRAVCDYTIAPINPHDNMILTRLIADLLLALFYLRYARAISLGRQQNHLRGLAPYALLAGGFMLAFKLPLLFLASQFSPSDVLLIAAEAVAAAAAFVLADHSLKEREKVIYAETKNF